MRVIYAADQPLAGSSGTSPNGSPRSTRSAKVSRTFTSSPLKLGSSVSSNSSLTDNLAKALESTSSLLTIPSPVAKSVIRLPVADDSISGGLIAMLATDAPRAQLLMEQRTAAFLQTQVTMYKRLSATYQQQVEELKRRQAQLKDLHHETVKDRHHLQKILRASKTNGYSNKERSFTQSQDVLKTSKDIVADDQSDMFVSEYVLKKERLYRETNTFATYTKYKKAISALAENLRSSSHMYGRDSTQSAETIDDNIKYMVLKAVEAMSTILVSVIVGLPATSTAVVKSKSQDEAGHSSTILDLMVESFTKDLSATAVPIKTAAI
jgi:hypothetical protein